MAHPFTSGPSALAFPITKPLPPPALFPLRTACVASLSPSSSPALSPPSQCVGGYLEPVMGAEAADAVAKEFRRRCEEDSRSKSEIDNYDDGPGEEMANCEFSLAYGERRGELSLAYGERRGEFSLAYGERGGGVLTGIWCEGGGVLTGIWCGGKGIVF